MFRWIIKYLKGPDSFDRIGIEQLYLTPVEYEQWRVLKGTYADRSLLPRGPAVEKNLEFLRAKIHELEETAHRRRDEWWRDSREVTQEEREGLRKLVEGGTHG